jgi:hypothetical protein
MVVRDLAAVACGENAGLGGLRVTCSMLETPAGALRKSLTDVGLVHLCSANRLFFDA